MKNNTDNRNAHHRLHPNNLSECKARRARLYSAIGNGAVAVVAAARECVRAGDSNYSYRQASDFYYLTGFIEPEAVAVFIPGRKEGEYILFGRPHDPTHEIWVGKRAGQHGASAIYGADQAFPISDIDALLPELLLGKRHLYYDFGGDPAFDARLIDWMNSARSKVRTGSNAPDDISYLSKIVHEMRLRCTPHEIALLRQSTAIAVDAHLRAMRACRPGMFEYELEAELCYEYTRRGGRAVAFPPIVAGGANACTLHYTENEAQLCDGDLVLIDAGVEYHYYASDITRTIPVGKRFSAEQRAIYQAVLDTQLAIIEKIAPGVRWNELQQISERVITEKLLALGLLQGKVGASGASGVSGMAGAVRSAEALRVADELDALVASGAYKQFYMHRFGHWLGIDTHDVGKYATDDGAWRMLEPGMTFTVEPGIYIAAGSAGVDEKWWNIGVRIEDDVLVTANGCEVLTAALPKSVAAIEKLR